MISHTDFSTDKLSDSVINWWQLAGVDQVYGDEATNWLAPAEAKQQPTDVTSVAAEYIPLAIKLPEDHPAFLEWLSTSNDIPGADWGRKRILPRGVPNAEMMIICAMPEPQDFESGRLFDGDVGRLLERMLAALNLNIDQCYFASLSPTRHPSGKIGSEISAAFADLMKHHIDLVSPKRVIILGNNAAHTLLGADLMNSRQKKHFVNHNVSKTESIATFHPRILLERPILKREAWNDLQLFL